MAVVAGLRIAPVKGLATISRDHIRLERAGVPEDRRAFLLDADGTVVTLRKHPQLVRLQPDLDLEGGVLTVRSPDGGLAETPLADTAEEVTAHLYGKDRVGRVLPGAVAAAVSEAAGEPVRVVLAGDVGTGWDEGPVSLLGRASAEAVAKKQDLARYRMLVELDATQPYEEDTWVGHEVRLGDAVVRVTHQLVRCVIITQSPQTGDKDWDGLHVLAQARGPDAARHRATRRRGRPQR
jgi:uncharacterized protein